jgi:hypothetical protein
MKIPEPYRGAYAAARKLRWSVTRTGGNHLKWQPPGGRFVITSASPGGGRHSMANDLDRLRDSGLPC